MPAGWYDTITEPDGGSHSAFAVDGNTITVELAEQALSTPGTNTVALLINGADGYQLASWNFALMIEPVPGLEAPEATAYYNALTEQVAKTLANAKAAAQSAAEAAASAEAAQQVAQGAVGYYETPDALEQAHPTAQKLGTGLLWAARTPFGCGIWTPARGRIATKQLTCLIITPSRKRRPTFTISSKFKT